MTVGELRQQLNYLEDNVVVEIQDRAWRQMEIARTELSYDEKVVECGGCAPPIKATTLRLVLVPKGN